MGREGISYNPSSGSLSRMFLWIAFHFFPGHCRNKGHKVKFNGVRICVTYVPWAHLCCYELKGRIYGMYSKNVLSLQSLSSMQLEKIPLGFLSFFFFCKGQLLSVICIFKCILIKIWKEASIEDMGVLSLCSLEVSLRKVF